MASLFFAGALFRGEREITVEIGSLRRRCLSGRGPAPFPTFPRPPGGVRLGGKRKTGLRPLPRAARGVERRGNTEYGRRAAATEAMLRAGLLAPLAGIW